MTNWNLCDPKWSFLDRAVSGPLRHLHHTSALLKVTSWQNRVPSRRGFIAPQREYLKTPPSCKESKRSATEPCYESHSLWSSEAKDQTKLSPSTISTARLWELELGFPETIWQLLMWSCQSLFGSSWKILQLKHFRKLLVSGGGWGLLSAAFNEWNCKNKKPQGTQLLFSPWALRRNEDPAWPSAFQAKSQCRKPNIAVCAKTRNKINKKDKHKGSMAISGTDWLEVPTIYKAYVRPM